MDLSPNSVALLFISDFKGGHSFWPPTMVWLDAGSDVLIGLASFSIQLTLLYFLRRNSGSRLRGLNLIFGGLVFACGLAQLLSLWNHWHSTYRLEELLKAVTALLSIAIAVVAVRVASAAKTVDSKMALGLVNDIVDRKHAADELVRVNTELRRSNAELSDFAYVASHDLQEPLEIASYLQLLDRRCQNQLDAEAREFIGYAVDGAARMKNLIQDLLSFSRASTVAASLGPVSAGTLVEQALTNLEVATKESHATVTVDPLPEIVADPGLFAQVFQNLIGNALKFHGPTAPSVRISSTRRGAAWIFSVRDNGIGIDPQHATRIFRIFERLHGADEYPGTGVGLAIAQKIVERHGGTIWFESQVGIGTTFYFSIPIQSAMAMAQSNSGSGA